MTLAEILVAGAVTASLGSAVVLLMSPADAIVRTEQDAVDVEQRLRVLVDTLTREVMAASDLQPALDGITVTARDAAGAAVSRTYFLKRATRQLMQSEGASTMPVVDHVARLNFTILPAPPRVRVGVAIEPFTVLPQRPLPPRELEFVVVTRAAAP